MRRPALPRDAGSCLALIALSGLGLGCGARTPLTVADAPPADLSDASVPIDDLPPPESICVEVPPGDEPLALTLTFMVRVASADVVLLVDVTGSMGDVVGQLRLGLSRDLIPALRDAIPDLHLSVASFADFPVSPYGGGHDRVFRVLAPSSADPEEARRGVAELTLQNGGDGPEAWVEALYQVATGAGRGRYVPRVDCPPLRFGAMCASQGRAPVVLLFTDALSHAAPPAAESYDPHRLGLTPAAYDETVGALRAVGAHVLGLYPGPGVRVEARAALAAIARDTGSLGGDGEPLVFDLGVHGDHLDEAVVRAVATWVDEAPLDVRLGFTDVPGDDVDARTLVESVRAIGAIPTDGATGSGDTFNDVRPGTRVSFQLVLDLSAMPPGPEPIRVPLDAVLRAGGGARVAAQRIELVVPAPDGRACGSSPGGMADGL